MPARTSRSPVGERARRSLLPRGSPQGAMPRVRAPSSGRAPPVAAWHGHRAPCTGRAPRGPVIRARSSTAHAGSGHRKDSTMSAPHLLPLRPPPVGRFGGGAPRVSWRYGLEPRTFGQPRPCVHRVRVRHAVADRCRVERHGGRQAAVGRWRASAGPRTPRRPVRVRRRRARADGPRGGGPGSEVERRRRLSSHSSSLCCS